MIPTFHWQQYSIIQHLLHTWPHHCREHPVNCLLFWSQLFEHYFRQPRCHHDWCCVPSVWITMLTISDHWQNNSVFAAFSLVSVSWGVCPSFLFKSKENVSESCQQKYFKKIFEKLRTGVNIWWYYAFSFQISTILSTTSKVLKVKYILFSLIAKWLERLV